MADIASKIARYLELKSVEKNLKAELAALGTEIRAAIPNGAAIQTDAGVAEIQEREQRTYKVTGKGGIMALFDRHPELDKSRYLTVKAAEVRKLPDDLQELLSYTVQTVQALIVK